VPAGHFDALFRPVAGISTAGNRDTAITNHTSIGFRPSLKKIGIFTPTF